TAAAGSKDKRANDCATKRSASVSCWFSNTVLSRDARWSSPKRSKVANTAAQSTPRRAKGCFHSCHTVRIEPDPHISSWRHVGQSQGGVSDLHSNCTEMVGSRRAFRRPGVV